MALVVADRVQETCSSPGTGSVTLLGAVSGYQSFSVIGNGNTTYYCIADQGGSNWEVGIGTWATGGTLARTTVLANSAGTTAKINFSSGTQSVFVTYPAEKNVSADTIYAPGTFSGTFTDGIVADYTTGNGRISVGTADTLSFYNGGVANTLLGQFGTDKTFTAAQLGATNGIVVNNQTVGASYSIPSGYSASSAGPVTVAGGVTVTVPSGSRWVVL